MENVIKKAAVTQLVFYAGHTINANGIVGLTFRARYSELVNTIKLFQMLNNDIFLCAKLPDYPKPVKAGYFRIKSIAVDGDGESKIKLSGLADSVEVDVLNLFPIRGEDVQEFKVRYYTEIELENEENA